MRQSIKQIVYVLLITVLLLVAALPGFAAAVRRVPSKNLVEQGFLALTLDAEGAEDFRYIGQESQHHIYRGRIKPGAIIKLTMQATLAKQSSLPLTGRTCTARMEVIAKKGGEVIKKNSFKSDNKSNVFINYTVPEGADSLEVNETFVLQNQSKEEKFNQKCTTKNKLILSVTEGSAVAAKTDSKTENGDKKTDENNDKKTGSDSDKKSAGSDADKKNDTEKKSDSENNKADASDAKESKGPGKGMLAGAVAAVAAIAGGGYYFLKKRKEDQAITEAIAKKEKLRQQAIRKQQEMLQRQGEMQQQEEAQQVMGSAGPQNAAEVQNISPQNAGTAAAAGAAGVMGGVQNQAAVNAPGTVQGTAPRFCESCGAPLKPGSQFCENCGTKV